MLRLLAVLFIAITAACSADLSAIQSENIQDYFKKIENKTSGHSMKNIDFIYVINLDKRPEKFAVCKEQLKLYGIEPFRFSAVNGWQLSLDTVNAVGVKYHPDLQGGQWGTSYLPGSDFKPVHDIVHESGRTYFCHCMSRGAIGIVLSHLSVLQDAYDSRYKTIWVMEDDIQIKKNPHILSTLISKLDRTVGKNNWDVLFTDRDTKNQQGNYVPCLGYAWRPNFTPSSPQRFSIRKNISPEFTRLNARYGAYSMIIRRSGMKKILKFIKKYKIFLPYDMDFNMPDDIRMFAVRDDVVSTIPLAASDNGGPNYEKMDQKAADKKMASKAMLDTDPDDVMLKQKVYASMRLLEGWCSNEKASVLIDMIRKHKPHVVVEIGVWGGKSLIPMAYAVQANHFGHVYGVDPWSPIASASGMDGMNFDWWSQVNHEMIYQGLVKRIAQFGLQKRITLVRATSAAAEPVANIGLLHIDGNHSEEASYIDVTKWVPLVKSGGYIIFDDVNWGTTSKAVDWLNQHCIPQFQITGDNIWGVWIKP